MTWIDIGHVVGEDLRHTPVDADPGDFDRAADHFAAIEDALNDVAHELRRLQTGGDEFKGKTAEAFVTKLAALSDDLGKVPVIAYQVKDIMRDHSSRLRDLRAEAERALATAKTRKTELEAARSRESQAGSRLAAIERQIRSLESAEAAGDEAAGSELVRVRYEQVQLSSEERGASGDVSRWLGEVRSSVGLYHELDQRERELNKQTVGRIHGIHFQGLHDPNAFERYIGRPVGEFLDDIRDFAVAIAEGDWETALWKLDDILATIGMVLAVVALVGLVVVGGPVGLGVMAAFAFATTKFTVASLIYITGAEDATEVGRKKTRTDLAMDGLGVVLAAAGLAPMMKHSHQVTKLVHPGGFQTFDVSRRYLSPAGRLLNSNGARIAKEGTSLGMDLAGGAQHYQSLIETARIEAPQLPQPRSLSGPTQAVLCTSR